jgi:hypothetical protein
VRIGWFPRNDAERTRISAHTGCHDIYLSHADAARFFECAVTSPTPGPGEWAVLFATSRPAHGPGLDMESAGRIIGYVPQDVWPA